MITMTIEHLEESKRVKRISKRLGVYGRSIFRVMADTAVSKRNLIVIVTEHFPEYRNTPKLIRYTKKLWDKLLLYKIIDQNGITQRGIALRKRIKDYDEIGYGKLLKKGFAPYRRKIKKEEGHLRWFRKQRYITVILPYPTTVPNVRLMKYGTYHRYKTLYHGKLIFEIDYKRGAVRGVGKTFGTMEGRIGLGDITQWVYYRRGVR